MKVWGVKNKTMEYYKVIKSRQDYKGVRYFKLDWTAEKVVQVVVNQGHPKKGRANVFGVGLIARISFLCNYLSIGYVEKCSKKEYDNKFSDVLKMLK